MIIARRLLAVAVVCMLLASTGAASAAAPAAVHIQAALRCMPDGGWAVLDDGVHASTGGVEVESYTDSGVWVSYPPASQIHTWIVAPDETLIAQGADAGTSVGTAHALIRMADGSGVRDPVPCTAWTTTSANWWIDAWLTRGAT